jgi:hypothetical protein
MPMDWFESWLQQFLGNPGQAQAQVPPVQFDPNVVLDPSQVVNWTGAQNPWAPWLQGIDRASLMMGTGMAIQPSPYFDALRPTYNGWQNHYPWYYPAGTPLPQQPTPATDIFGRY